MESKIEDLRCELLQCAICLGELDSPRVLQCLHSFCEKCIQTHSDSYRQSRPGPTSYFPCPSCRVLTLLPPGGIKELNKDFRVRKITDVLRSFSSALPKSFTHTCSLCRLASNIQQQAVKYCLDCDKSLCHECSSKHHRKTALLSHQLLDLSQQRETTQRKSGCVIHKNEPELYFCNPCERRLCVVCLSIHDDDHHVVRTDNGVKGTEARSITLDVQDQLWKAREVLFRLGLLEGKMKSSHDEIRVQIRKHAREFIANVCANESRLLQTLDKLYQEKSQRLFQRKEECKGNLEDLESVQNRIHFLLTLQDGGKKVDEVNQSLRTKMDYIQAATVQLDTVAEQLSGFVTFSANQGSPSLGNLEDCALTLDTQEGGSSSVMSSSSPINTVVLSDDNEPLYLSGVARVAVSRSPSLTSSSVDPGIMTGAGNSSRLCPQVSLLCRFGNSGTRIGEFSLPYTIAFLANDNIAVSDLGNKRVQIVDKFGHCEKVIAPGEIMPRSLTTMTDGTIAITDECDKTVKLFSQSGSLLINLGMDSLSFPYGIACTSQRNFVVSDMIYESISIIGSMGRVIQRFGSHGRGDNSLDNPGCIFVDKEDNIFVSDTGNHCLKIFNKHGRFVRRIGGYGDKDGQLKYPKSVCMDNSGCVYVADSGNDRVVAFTTSGTFLGNVITHENRIKRPTGLTCNSSGTLLAVSQPDIGEIRVYKLVKHF